MAELITLDWFGAKRQGYHIALIGSTPMDHHDHYHEYYQVCYVVSGKLIHQQEGRAVPLGAGDAFIVPPGFVHSLHFENEKTMMYSLAFSQSVFQMGFSQSNAFRFLESLAKENAVRLRVVPGQERGRLMEGLLKNLLLQQEINCPTGLSAAPGILAGIVYLLAQSYYAQPQNADKLEGIVHYDNAMQRCVEYIDRNFAQKLSLTELTKRSGLSRSAFCAAFPQFAGMSLRKYIAQKRISRAQVLIRSHPEWSVERIAGEVGYEDSSTFYRNFLKITGVSPTTYRQNCNTAE